MNTTSSVVLPSASIDVGYFQTKYCAGRGSKDLHCGSFPSLAPMVTGADINLAGMQKLRGVAIQVDNARYFVGEDSLNFESSLSARNVTEEYSQTAQYKALSLGALRAIAMLALASHPKASQLEISTLTVGLPLNTLATYSRSVQSMMTGEHRLPGRLEGDQDLLVKVKRAVCVPQPLGALTNHVLQSVRSGRTSEADLANQKALIVDCGGGTIDWLVMQNRRPMVHQSGAYPSGTLAAAFSVCEQIKPGSRDNPAFVANVDHALQQGTQTIRYGGRELDLSQYTEPVRALLSKCIGRLAASVGDLQALDQFVVTGGGAKLMHEQLLAERPALAALVTLDEDPVYSNVKGFFHIGESMNRGEV